MPKSLSFPGITILAGRTAFIKRVRHSKERQILIKK
jgi:hypothetical protein